MEQISTWNFEKQKTLCFSKNFPEQTLKNILGEIFRSLLRTTPFTQTDRRCCWCCVNAQQDLKGLLSSLNIYSGTVLADKALLSTIHRTKDKDSTHAKLVTCVSYRYCMSMYYSLLWMVSFNLSWNGTDTSPPSENCKYCVYCVVPHILAMKKEQADLLGRNGFVSESGQKQAEKLLENSTGF